MTFDGGSRSYDHDHAPIVLPRVPTEDLAVHVLVDGTYHRRHPRLGRTSCGIFFNAQFCPVRREELTHPLSKSCDCFTQAELAEADEAARQEQG